MRRSPRAVAALLLAAACAFPTDGSDDVLNFRGGWTFSAEQVSPPRTLTGTLTVSAQTGELVGGTIEWQETDGLGGLVLGGGTMTGQVIGLDDIDIEVATGAGVRRFVGARTADTITGTWLQLTAGGPSGTFRLERGTP